MKIVHALIIAAGLGLALAAQATQAQVTQREKMKACNADAKATAKKGAERKTFMKACLSSGSSNKGAVPAPAKGASPRQVRP